MKDLDIKNAHKLKYATYWVLVDPSMPEHLLEKLFPNMYLFKEKQPNPAPSSAITSKIRNWTITRIEGVKYRGGGTVHSLRRGAEGVIESRDEICSFLHCAETGKCWRDSRFDIMDFERVKKLL